MRVLVTGGTGYLGSAIVRTLAVHGHEPIVFARRASEAGLPGRPVDGDVRDLAAVRAAVTTADAVIHAAALVSIWRRREADFDDVNVGGLQTVLQACRDAGVPRIVYTSSFLAQPPAGRHRALDANPYQRTKARALEVARQACRDGLPVVIVIPGVIYGPGPATDGNLVGRLVSDHLAGRLPGLVGADRVWSFAHVEDVARGHVAALSRGRPGGEYALGGENAPQMRIFEIVQRLRGGRLPRRLPRSLATIAGSLESVRARVTGGPPLVTPGVVDILGHDWPLNSACSVAELSYRMTPLEEGIEGLFRPLP